MWASGAAVWKAALFLVILAACQTAAAPGIFSRPTSSADASTPDRAAPQAASDGSNTEMQAILDRHAKNMTGTSPRGSADYFQVMLHAHLQLQQLIVVTARPKDISACTRISPWLHC